MKRWTTLALAVVLTVCLSACCMQHIYSEATCTEPATCTKCGKTDGEALGHDWIAADCENPKTCSVCGATEGEPLGHSWMPATCIRPATCSICGATQGEALGHSWVAATTTRPRTCSVCGETEGEPLSESDSAEDSDDQMTYAESVLAELQDLLIDSDYSTASTRGVRLELPNESDILSDPFYAVVVAHKTHRIYVMPKPKQGNGNLGMIKGGTEVRIVAESNGFYFFVAEDGQMGWNGKTYFKYTAYVN